MDDIRSRYRTPRRDYTAGPGRPAAGRPHHNGVEPMFAPRRPQPTPPAAQPQPRPEPIPQNVQHQHPAHHVQPAPAQRHIRKKKRWVLKVIITLIILAGLAGGGLFAYQKFWAPNPFSSDIRQSKLDLLYPAKLPAGYKVNQQNMSLSNGILIYDATNQAGSRLVFTLQSTPANFDFNAFYKQQLVNNAQYPTNFGTAVIGKNSNRSLGSLVDGDTWLLLSTNSTSVSVNDMALVLKNLKHY